MEELTGRIAFIKEAERLKNVLRSAHTSSGRRESTAEHTWRLCLMAITFADQLGSVDVAKLLRLCVIHDLGEALHGDIPATEQTGTVGKSEQERKDLIELTRTLPPSLQAEFVTLWEDYEYAGSREARIVKALDKLETIIQHNQGLNPPDFDYAFNLTYGQKHTAADPLFAAIRAIVDEETRERAAER
jgi:putative hydrolase of HD superfamily